jgi:hypothetical protein
MDDPTREPVSDDRHTQVGHPPSIGPPAPAEAFYTGLDFSDRAPAGRPYVIANFISSVDGKATADGRTAQLGSPGDRAAFHLLRTEVDAVLAGNRTMFIENYGPLAKEPRLSELRARGGREPQPLGVVISRSGTIPFEIPLFSDPSMHRRARMCPIPRPMSPPTSSRKAGRWAA